MNMRYPTTPLEQQVLRVIESLQGTADQKTICRKIEEFEAKKTLQPLIIEALIRLEDEGYISSALSEASDAHTSGNSPRKLYRIEVFGERALSEPPLADLISPTELKGRVILTGLVLYSEMFNTWTLHIDSLNRPLQIAFLVMMAWTFLGVYQLRKAISRIGEWRSSSASKQQ